MPSPVPPNTAQARGYLMTAVRMGDAEGEATARRELAEAKLQNYIERIVASAPPLTPEQIKRLSGLLRTGGSK